MSRYCIHQSCDEVMSAVLYRMPLYLQGSKELLCVFDQQYISRLWCIFELAVYLKLRKRPAVHFINTAQKTLEITIVSWKLIFFAVSCFVHRNVGMSIGCGTGKCPENPFWLWYQLIDDLLLKSVVFILGQRWFLDMISMREVIQTYDVRLAELSDPADRRVLLQFVNHYWGSKGKTSDGRRASETADASGLNNFNQHIRTRVNRYLPVKGPRSWIIMSYVASVIYMCLDALVNFDYWGYHAMFNDEASLARQYDQHHVYKYYKDHKDTLWKYDLLSYYWSDLNQGFTSVLGLASRLFIMGPMNVFVLGIQVRVCLYCQQLLRLPYWLGVAIFLPIYLFVECILAWRVDLFFNLKNLVGFAFGSKVMNVAVPSFSSKFANPTAVGYLPKERGVGVLGADPFVVSYQDDVSQHFIGTTIFSPDVSLNDTGWPIVIRPFWGVFYLWQFYFGSCSVEEKFHKQNFRVLCEMPILVKIGLRISTHGVSRGFCR